MVQAWFETKIPNPAFIIRSHQAHKLIVAQWCHIASLICVNNGSSNDFLSDSTKSSPELMLSYHQYENDIDLRDKR